MDALSIVEPRGPARSDSPGRQADAAEPVTDVPPTLRRALDEHELDLPLPGRGETARRWTALAGYGRRDLSLARLAEGHTDAVAILAETGVKPHTDALYGVWASRASGRGAVLRGSGTETVLTGTVPFCSGADLLDRALVVARPEGTSNARDDVVIDLALTDSRVRTVPDTWHAAGMAASRTRDVELHGIPVRAEDHIGRAGWYTSRPGFALGGAGVAAVWLGGAVGVLDRVLDYLADREPDEHQLAHTAAMHTALVTADNTLSCAAATVDGSRAAPEPEETAAVCRSVVERAAGDVLTRSPRVTGPGPLSRDPVYTRRLADLEVYVRQHHGERELADLGRRLVLSHTHGPSQ